MKILSGCSTFLGVSFALFLLYAGLNVSGFCFAEMRYLSDEDKFRKVFEGMNRQKTLPIKITKDGKLGYEYYEQIKYESFEQFMEINPYCCAVDPGGPNVRISKRADNWYISFKYDIEPVPTEKVEETIGVDIGINTLATCSDGSKFANVKAYRQAKKQLVHHQRAVSKKVIGSKNRIKAVKKLAKLHKRVADIRADTLHKLTTWLAKNHSTIVIEDLNVSGMLKNHKLASAIADCGFYEFKRQLTYKCEWYGSKLVIADRFYPSSQLCSPYRASTENAVKCENL